MELGLPLDLNLDSLPTYLPSLCRPVAGTNGPMSFMMNLPISTGCTSARATPTRAHQRVVPPPRPATAKGTGEVRTLGVVLSREKHADHTACCPTRA